MAGRLIVTSCGTSLLTNEAPPALRERLIQGANVTRAAEDAILASLVEQRVAALAEELSSDDVERARGLSAEINSLLAFEQEGDDGGGPRARDHHILVHTDTLQGETTAVLVKDWLERDGRAVRLMTASGLRTADLDEFRLALSDLARQLMEEIPDWRAAGASVHFNLTGGFKGMQGFLQALGFVIADEVLYLFEGGRALLRIPRLPLSLASDDALIPHLDLLRRLVVDAPASADDVRGLPETLMEIVGDEAQLSPWGRGLVTALIERVGRRKLFEPLSARLALSHRFRREVGALDPDRLHQINRQLDRLAAHLEGWRSPGDSLEIKPLKGKPVPGCTHEVYAWSDQDARRMFGCLEDGHFSVDQLGRHL